MRRCGRETGVLAAVRQEALWPVDAVCMDARGESRVGGNQKQQAAPSADGRQAACCAPTIRRTKMPINQSRPAWQASGDGKRIWGALWIGEEKQCWDCGRSRRAVEPRSEPR
jgi:hypothetical protein